MGIERAILSVSDKTGILELARALQAKGVQILSTGGTAKHLTDAGIEVTPIAAWSGAPEILGGRVKTLTPKVFGAILHDRANREHIADCQRLSIPPVDLVVVNLYPFETTIAREGVTIAEAIEQIDIGGPSMLRAAAKNYRHVVPLCDPSLYSDFLREFERGDISEDFRLRCAIAVFERTSQYDATIVSYLRHQPIGAMLHLALRKFQDLRYGENPQQSASFYVEGGVRPFEQVQGKELSYNNLLDLDAAVRLAHALPRSGAAVIKHTNPCGAARGGSVGNVHAPIGKVSFSADALSILSRKKNLRLVTIAPPETGTELRSAAGGVLVQSVDKISPPANWKVVSRRQPETDEIAGLEFAWIVCAHVKSNAIVLTDERQSIGIGAGQMSRIDAAKVAIMKASRETRGALAASDAFFPFRDGLDILAAAGVRAVIQPGGSVRDEEVIAAANEHGMSMLFTGERHFRH